MRENNARPFLTEQPHAKQTLSVSGYTRFPFKGVVLRTDGPDHIVIQPLNMSEPLRVEWRHCTYAKNLRIKTPRP